MSITFAPAGGLAYLGMTNPQSGSVQLQVVQVADGAVISTRAVGAIGTLILLPR